MPADARARLDQGIRAVEGLRSAIRAGKNRQVRNKEELTRIRAVAQVWFNDIARAALRIDSALAEEVTQSFTELVACADRNTTRARYVEDLAELKNQLIVLRDRALTAATQVRADTSEVSPEFKTLVPDPVMAAILERRWREIGLCVHAGAHLAAVVMMGGLLEGLFLSRVVKLADKAPLFKTAACPKDKNGKPVSLKEWMLNDYIGVAHELGWIGRSAKDVSVVMRDYRNYVHPQKEYSHGVSVQAEDVPVMWAVFREIAKQLLRGSPGTPPQRLAE